MLNISITCLTIWAALRQGKYFLFIKGSYGKIKGDAYGEGRWVLRHPF